MRLIDFFDSGAAHYPDNIAFVDGDRQQTYSEALKATNNIACAMRANGYKKGSKAGILAPNSIEAFLVLLGLFRSQCTWLPVNPINSVDVNVDLLDRFACDVLYFHSKFLEAAEAIQKRVPGIKQLVCVDQSLATHDSIENWTVGEDRQFPEEDWDLNEVMAIFPTGGTTGQSKGVMMSHKAIYTMAANFFAHFDYYDDTAHLVVAPMTHSSGIMGCLHFARGGKNVIMAKAVPEEILQNIQEHKITHLFLPPTVLYVLLATPNVGDFDYSSLRHFLVAAAPVSVDKLKEALTVFGPVMTEVFGQAEAPAAVLAKAPWDYIDSDGNVDVQRLGSAGRPCVLNRVGIMDDDGNLLPNGTAGEIVVKGDLVTPGYYENPEETAKVRTFGWHHTGDVGVMADDGFVTIVDRKKDMIISGGFNIFPNEIEQVLAGHLAVQDCAVIGVPDEKWGEAVKAIVQLKPQAEVSGEELKALVKERLGSVKSPKSVDLVSELPRSPAGKVLKVELRKKYWGDKKRGVN